MHNKERNALKVYIFGCKKKEKRVAIHLLYVKIYHIYSVAEEK